MESEYDFGNEEEKPESGPRAEKSEVNLGDSDPGVNQFASEILIDKPDASLVVESLMNKPDASLVFNEPERDPEPEPEPDSDGEPTPMLENTEFEPK